MTGCAITKTASWKLELKKTYIGFNPSVIYLLHSVDAAVFGQFLKLVVLRPSTDVDALGVKSQAV